MQLSIRDARLATLGLILMALAGCEDIPDNRLLDSVHQPVVEHSAYQLDLVTGPDGLTAESRLRLEGWFSALALHYGDRIALDDPLESPQTRAEVKTAAARYGLPIGPAPANLVGAGTVRITVSRSIASVPHCPDLTTKSESNFNNGTSSNYGCAVNSNLAAMVTDPDQWLNGAHGPTLTTVDTSDKAIWMHQAAAPTGQAAVAKNSTN